MTQDDAQYAQAQIEKVRERIRHACDKAGRHIDEVTLIGASKRQTPALISQFVNQGLNNLGENYLQEALEKTNALSELTLNWHFIGQIQSNKTKVIAENFSWVHGVDRFKIAQRLATQTPLTTPINVLVQLNPDNEQSKGGVTLCDAPALCDQIAQLSNIALRGFMMIPQARDSKDEQRQVFAKAHELIQKTNQDYGLTMDTLSMGMSGDLEAAIEQGSTMIRIGTDLFGARK